MPLHNHSQGKRHKDAFSSWYQPEMLKYKLLSSIVTKDFWNQSCCSRHFYFLQKLLDDHMETAMKNSGIMTDIKTKPFEK